MKKKFYVIGMLQEVVHTMVPGDDNGMNDMVDGTMDVFHLYMRDWTTGDIYDFSFWTDEGWCGSGYTTASWGCYDFSKCENKHIPMIFNYAYRRPDKTVLLDLDSDGNPQVDETDNAWGNIVRVYDSAGNPIIEVNDDGGDEYYPCGGVSLYKSYWRRIRGTDEIRRKVFVFTGPSAIGKSYLVSKLAGDSDMFFDTDEKGIIGDTVITATYIVIGQKRPYSLEDVIKHIYDRENTDIVVVNMEQSKEV